MGWWKNERTDESYDANRVTMLDNSVMPSKYAAPYIVVIGAFGDAIESIECIFRHAEENAAIAFIIINHYSSEECNALKKRLQGITKLHVTRIIGQKRIVANHIYLLPADKKISIHQGVLNIADAADASATVWPYDFFLCQIAKDQGPNVICIILSGMTRQGMLGLRALRDQGCLMVAQTKTSPHYESLLPNSAIDSGLIDYILLPEDMPTFIANYIMHIQDKSIVMPDNLSTELQKILSFLNQQLGHDFSLYKLNTIFRRIQKRMEILQLDTLSDYLYYLHQHVQEITILYNEFLINVTYFFRDPEAFEQLKKILMNTLLRVDVEKHAWKVWIPACSTGEEAYSIAIMLLECIRLLGCDLKIRIFATDVDVDAIETARLGMFPSSIKKQVSPERLQRYFTKENGGYKINFDVRKTIIFAIQNVITDPPFTKIDLLSCRNLLIYLKAELQKKLIPLFHYSLNPNGFLFLGLSENVGRSDDLFDVLDRKYKIYNRKNGATTHYAATDASPINRVFDNTRANERVQIMHKEAPSLANLVKNIVTETSTPVSCIVIDEKGDIVYVYGKTGRFLELASGTIQLHFMEMIQSELKAILQIAIDDASAEQKEITLNKLQLTEQDELKYVRLKVRPIHDPEPSGRKLILIVIEEIIIAEQPPIADKKLLAKWKMNKRIDQLEEELIFTKKSLQSKISTLEASNEELKLINEDLQSVNEELQSTNEELQSTNEEVTTVNTELENCMEQLASDNDDITNLLDNTEIATILLDKHLCIKRFTAKATELVNLIPTDVGRPFSHILSNLQYEQLMNDAKTVLSTSTPIITECVDKSNQWHVIRIIPYRTVAKLIDGVIIMIFDLPSQMVTRLEPLENDLAMIESFNKTLLNGVSNASFIVDKNAIMVMANTQFLSKFSVKQEDIVGHSIYALNLPWDNKSLKNIIVKLFQGASLVNITECSATAGNVVMITAYKISSTISLLVLN